MRFRIAADDGVRLLPKGSLLGLEADPANEHDPGAVKVMTGQRHYGFLSRGTATALLQQHLLAGVDLLARTIEEGTKWECRAEIVDTALLAPRVQDLTHLLTSSHSQVAPVMGRPRRWRRGVLSSDAASASAVNGQHVRMLRVVIVGDTHDMISGTSKNDLKVVPDLFSANMPHGDVLAIVGDWESAQAVDHWIASLSKHFRYFLVVHGNHDVVHRNLTPQAFTPKKCKRKRVAAGFNVPLSAQDPVPLAATAPVPSPTSLEFPSYDEAKLRSLKLQRKLRANQKLHNAVLLLDSGVEIEGIRFWGTPWLAPGFPPHLFCAEEAVLKGIYEQIPNSVDVWLTHGPPYGVLDRPGPSFRRNLNSGPKDDISHVLARDAPPPCGTQEMRRALDRLQPALHAFGHVHARQSGYREDRRWQYIRTGVDENGAQVQPMRKTMCVNAAVLQTVPTGGPAWSNVKGWGDLALANPLCRPRRPAQVQLQIAVGGPSTVQHVTAFPLPSSGETPSIGLTECIISNAGEHAKLPKGMNSKNKASQKTMKQRPATAGRCNIAKASPKETGLRARSSERMLRRAITRRLTKFFRVKKPQLV